MPAKEKSEAVYTRPNSDAALEAQVNAEAPKPRVAVNPNPFGEEEFVNVDPIYQNYANDQNKPFAAQDGADKLAEERTKELHDLDGEETVDDQGTGGKASKADQSGPGSIRYLLPGQEGYDETVAQSQVPHRADAVKADDSGSNSSDGKKEEEQSQAPAPPVPGV